MANQIQIATIKETTNGAWRDQLKWKSKCRLSVVAIGDSAGRDDDDE